MGDVNIDGGKENQGNAIHQIDIENSMVDIDIDFR